MKFLGFANRTIEYLFYSLFLLVPLVFAGNTSELFEFNKMWLTFGITILIGFLWFSKMLLLKQVIFRRTIFDIPILLFLISQFISTLISIEPHISLWGYYSRWNGGLLSTIAYIFLYYAFVSNFWNNAPTQITSKNPRDKQGFFEKEPSGQTVVKRSLLISLISGLIVVLWAIPSHFGYDPTCLLFRGTFDVACWTNDFQPRVRIFGPLGQPDWLAGYLGVLLPITAAFILNTLRNTKKLFEPRLLFYALSFMLFYLALLYSGSRSGIAGTILALIIFFAGYVFLNRKDLGFFKNRLLASVMIIVIAITLIVGIELPNGKRISFAYLQNHFNKVSQKVQNQIPSQTPTVSDSTPTSSIPLGGSSSLLIRKIVWRGAVDAWKANPIFGTGVETFAFAYYKYRPVEHNTVSEWNFLYNKAHNEYLNYLVTTGAFGLLSYLSFIGLFLAISAINILNIKIKPIKYIGAFKSEINWDRSDPLILALTSSFLAILIINFFGFSVVILNIYLFLIPAFILTILNLIKYTKPVPSPKLMYISLAQWAGVGLLAVSAVFMIWMLAKFWIADTKYALGFNYNQVGEFQTAYPLLQEAVKMRKEPVFLNEMSVNDANLAVGLAAQASSESATTIQNLATQALTTSEQLTKEYPNNIVYWKTRVRVLYILSRLDPSFYPQALAAIQQTALLAPTDASILYNLGVLYGQTGESKKAIEVLEKTISYRPHYSEAHFALGLFYHDLSVNKSGVIIDPAYHQKAIDQMEYILQNLNPKDTQAKEYLTAWGKEK